MNILLCQVKWIVFSEMTNKAYWNNRLLGCLRVVSLATQTMICYNLKITHSFAASDPLQSTLEIQNVPLASCLKFIWNLTTRFVLCFYKISVVSSNRAISEQLLALRCAPAPLLSTWKGAPRVCPSSTDRDSDWISEWLRSWSLRPWRSGTAGRTVYPSVLSQFCMLAVGHKREDKVIESVTVSEGVCGSEKNGRCKMGLLCNRDLPWYRHLWHLMPFRCR